MWSNSWDLSSSAAWSDSSALLKIREQIEYGQFSCTWDNVVCGLCHVDVVIRVDNACRKKEIIMKTRIEADSIGSLEVPSDAYYGVQSLRAKRNFPITGTSIHPALPFDTGRITPGQKFVNTAAEELWNLIYFCI